MLKDSEMLEIAERFQAGFYRSEMRSAPLTKCYTSSAYARDYQTYAIHQLDIIVRPELQPGDPRRTQHTYFMVHREKGTVSCRSYDVFGARV